MQFSEKQLVDLFWEDGQYDSECSPLKQTWDTQAVREFALPSGKRADLLVHTKNYRMFWVIEFKIVAEPSAILQAWNYRKEIFRTQGTKTRRLRAGFASIAAQFFKPETLFFAEQMGIGCIHLNPVNYHDLRVETILPLRKEMQHANRLHWTGIYG